MDIVSPSDRPRLAAANVRRAAAEAGIGPGDPMAPLVDAFSETLETLARIPERHEERLEQLLSRAETIAGGQIAKHAAAELPRAIESLGVSTFRRAAISSGAVVAVLLAVAVGGGYLWGSSDRAERFVNLKADFDIAMTGSDAAIWLNLIKLNGPTGVIRKCNSQPQPSGGEACLWALWTKLPSPR